MMKNMNKKRNLIVPAIGILIYLLMIIHVTHGGNLFCDAYDWSSQHVVLPDYMRKQFYTTGKLFPDFAMNLGAGQNIYYIAYYGLLSPIVLFSYLLPFVPMVYYMTGSAIVICILSIILIYRWLSHHLSGTALYVAFFMFTLATPLMYHSHHHLMFVNYLPFMILAMEGMEKYVLNGKKIQLVLSVFLIIMSSYFFSVGAICCLMIYRIYLYLSDHDKRIISLKFITDIIRTLCVLMISVMMSAVLWLPELYVMLSGRASGGSTFSLMYLFLPHPHILTLLYCADGMGLTGLFLICIAGLLFCGKREDRACSILFFIFMIFPLPVYILNGGMYLNGKVLIPFLPLAVLISGHFIRDILDIAKGPASRRRLSAFFILMLIPGLIAMSPAHNRNNFFSRSDYPVLKYQKDYGYLISKVSEKSGKEIVRTDIVNRPAVMANYVHDPGQFRSSIYSSLNNRNYHDYFFTQSGNEISGRSNASIRPVKNPMNSLMLGVRYIIGETEDTGNAPVGGYHQIASHGGLSLYENSDVLPIGYAVENDFTPVTEDLSTDKIRQTLLSEDGVSEDSNSIDFNLHSTKHIRIPIQPSDKRRIITISMHVVNNTKKDMHITINGTKNTLPYDHSRYFNGNNDFHYTLMISPGTDHLRLTASEGDYNVSGITMNSFDYDEYLDWKKNVSAWHPVMHSDNMLSGQITAASDSVMHITVPYDNGFTCYVDNRVSTIKKDRYGFISVPVTSGSHEIRLVFHAPYKRAGIIISLAGMLLFIISCIFSIHRKLVSESSDGLNVTLS